MSFFFGFDLVCEVFDGLPFHNGAVEFYVRTSFGSHEAQDIVFVLGDRLQVVRVYFRPALYLLLDLLRVFPVVYQNWDVPRREVVLAVRGLLVVQPHERPEEAAEDLVQRGQRLIQVPLHELVLRQQRPNEPQPAAQEVIDQKHQQHRQRQERGALAQVHKRILPLALVRAVLAHSRAPAEQGSVLGHVPVHLSAHLDDAHAEQQPKQPVLIGQHRLDAQKTPYHTQKINRRIHKMRVPLMFLPESDEALNHSYPR